MSKTKLDLDQIGAIVQKHKTGNWSQIELADFYGVHRKTIYNILKRKGLLGVHMKLTSKEAHLIHCIRERKASKTGLINMLLALLPTLKEDTKHVA